MNAEAAYAVAFVVGFVAGTQYINWRTYRARQVLEALIEREIARLEREMRAHKDREQWPN